MGVEYRHFLVVNEANWRQQPDTAARVDRVLREWQIVDTLNKVVNLAPGANHAELNANINQPLGHGTAFEYAGVTGAAVQRIAGDSHYPDITVEDRYTMNTTLVVGDDYRVHWSGDGIYFELQSPPTVNGKPLIGIEDEDPYGILFSNSFPSYEATTPPVVKAHIAEYQKKQVPWQHYQGYWQAAVVIEFGKDIPLFAEGVQMLPSREFVVALGEAFRGSILEVGDFH